MINLGRIQTCGMHGFLSNMMRIWKWMFMRLLIAGSRLGRRLLHLIFAIYYCGRGEIVPQIKNELLLKSATRLASDIREGKLKSEDVVQAYIERIREVEPYINATTYQRFSEAVQEAREVDQLIASGKMSRSQLINEKPLLGIPISVKILIQVNGLPFTGASFHAKDVIAKEDADAIKQMKKAGAIVLVTTNAPEKGLYMETVNKLYGRTNNPYDTSRSSSGSSGGEAALIGAGASVIGLGNDTAGSLRMPGLFCGIYGHKPSPGLISPHGQFACFANVTSIGPMCRYAEDLTIAMKVLTMDKEIAIIDKMVDFKKLKICYVMSMASPFSAKLDDESREAFVKVFSYFERTYGIKANEVDIPLLKQSEAIFLHNLISTAGNTDEIKKAIRLPPELNPTKELFKYLIGISKYTVIVPFLLNCLKCPLWYRQSNVQEYKALLQQLQEEFDKLLDENTVFLCPTLPQTALHHVETQILGLSLSYVGLWNFLGLPATHCPLGLNKKGLPLGIQVIAGKNNDALNLSVACELEKAFGGWVPPKKK